MDFGDTFLACNGEVLTFETGDDLREKLFIMSRVGLETFQKAHKCLT